jgi:RNA polymerase sigma-70 factor (ECF subfamily)
MPPDVSAAIDAVYRSDWGRIVATLIKLVGARRDARHDANGNLVLLEDQDRGLWNRAQIQEGLTLADAAMTETSGPFVLQAGIAAVHCRAARAQDTDWREILRLYGLLERVHPSPIVSLNRAVAVAMVQGASDALNLVEEIAAGGELESYHLLHATRADLLRRMGDSAGAAKSYRHALALATNDAERRYLAQRLGEV